MVEGDGKKKHNFRTVLVSFAVYLESDQRKCKNMQDFFNTGIILLWPFLCCLLYIRLETVTATFISIVAGFLLLPVRVSFDLPLIPDIDKNFSSFSI